MKTKRLQQRLDDVMKVGFFGGVGGGRSLT